MAVTTHKLDGSTTPLIEDQGDGTHYPIVKVSNPSSGGGGGGGAVTVTPGGTTTNRSGTIATGGTAQTAAAANSLRKYLLIQNPTTATASFWVNFGTTAVIGNPSVEIAPGVTITQEANFCSTELISVIGATTGQGFIIKEGQ